MGLGSITGAAGKWSPQRLSTKHNLILWVPFFILYTSLHLDCFNDGLNLLISRHSPLVVDILYYIIGIGYHNSSTRVTFASIALIWPYCITLSLSQKLAIITPLIGGTLLRKISPYRLATVGKVIVIPIAHGKHLSRELTLPGHIMSTDHRCRIGVGPTFSGTLSSPRRGIHFPISHTT